MDKDYKLGWNCAKRGGSLEAADRRGVSRIWYKGFFDYASGRPFGATENITVEEYEANN